MKPIPILAATDGAGLIHQAFIVLIFAVCGLIIWYLGSWIGKKFGAPAIALTVWDGLFVLVAAIVVINFLLSLIGHGFIAL
jgi:hypothetical protein